MPRRQLEPEKTGPMPTTTPTTGTATDTAATDEEEIDDDAVHLTLKAEDNHSLTSRRPNPALGPSRPASRSRQPNFNTIRLSEA